MNNKIVGYIKKNKILLSSTVNKFNNIILNLYDMYNANSGITACSANIDDFKLIAQDADIKISRIIRNLLLSDEFIKYKNTIINNPKYDELVDNLDNIIINEQKAQDERILEYKKMIATLLYSINVEEFRIKREILNRETNKYINELNNIIDSKV